MSSLSLDSVLSTLSQKVATFLPRQVTDPSDAQYGGYVNPEWDLAVAKQLSTPSLLVSCALLALGVKKSDSDVVPFDSAMLLERANMAADYMLNAQLPTGRLDNRRGNYDAGTVAAFVSQELCTVIELGRPLMACNGRWRELLGKLERFVRKAVPGILTGGFHTPNHRWVVASALVQAAYLFPDLKESIRPALKAYLQEEPDIDAEGAWIERSVGVYDGACDRCMLFLAEQWDYAKGREAAQANLNFNLFLLHADGTAETGLSRRQDFETRVVPTTLCDSYLRSNALRANPQFVRAAQVLWERAEDYKIHHLLWMAYALIKHGEPASPDISLPDDYSKFFEGNGIWRIKRGLLSASIFADAQRILRIRYGEAELTSLSIAQSYFNVGEFVADRMKVEGKVATLWSDGERNPRRPGYDKPLGRPVAPNEWLDVSDERAVRRLPASVSRAWITEVEGGFDLAFETSYDYDGVAGQIAFDFPPGGIWETEDTRIRTRAGQILFLKKGYGRMRYGNDVIEIGPGVYAHGNWDLRCAPPIKDRVRIVFTFLTPFEYECRMRTYRGL